MGQDMSTWERIGHGQAEADAKMRAEHARFKAALEAVREKAAEYCSCSNADVELAAIVDAALEPNGKENGGTDG